MAGSILNRRQFIGLVGAFAATSALASCSAISGPGDGAQNPPKTADHVDAIELTDKNVEVIYWHNRPQADHNLLQSMLDEFNRSNEWGIRARAEIAGASSGDLYKRVSAAIEADQPPDISVAEPYRAAVYRVRGAIVDLAPFQKSGRYGLSATDLDDYYPGLLDVDVSPWFPGERLGFATQRSLEVMYYNGDWLERLGHSEPPRDWTTFEEIAGRASDPASERHGLAVRHDASSFASQVFARGGRMLALDGRSYVFSDRPGVDATGMLQRMLRRRNAVGVPTTERNGERERFAAGESLFVFASSAGLRFYGDAIANGAKFGWGIAPLPSAGKPAMNLYGASLLVHRTTPERELAAWLVLKFLGEKAQASRWAEATGYLPVRASAMNDVLAAHRTKPRWDGEADSYAQLAGSIPDAVVEPVVAGYEQVRALIEQDVIARVIADSTADPWEILDGAVVKANATLKEYALK